MTTLTTACLTARRLDSRSLILKQEDKKKINEVDDHRGYTLGSKLFCRNAYNKEERDIAQHITCNNQCVAQESNSRQGMYSHLKKVILFKIYIPPRYIMESI